MSNFITLLLRKRIAKKKKTLLKLKLNFPIPDNVFRFETTYSRISWQMLYLGVSTI